MSITKNKRHPNGLGDHAIDCFLSALTALEGGRVVAEDDQLRIKFRLPRPSVIVKRNPADPDEWRIRFENIEKRAAIILGNPPVVYSMVWPTSKPAKHGRAVLRLSVGLSLSVGEPLSRRYVVTLTKDARQASIVEGGLPPAETGATTAILSTLPRWAEQRVKELSHAVLEACDLYQGLPAVRSAMNTLGERRRTELAQIEHLYARRQKSKGQLYGLPEPGTQGSASIEAEQRRLQQIVFERFTVQVRVRMLSLGILEGSIPVINHNQRQQRKTRYEEKTKTT
jgi:hypothetical protein